MEFFITMTLFAIIASLTFLNLLIHKTRMGKLIDRIPGPAYSPIIGNVLDFLVSTHELWRILRSLGKEYYSTYKIWLGVWPFVFLRHPDDVEILFSSQQNISKSLVYDFLQPWLKKGLLTSTEKWRQRRKMLTPAFHFKLLRDSVAIFVETSERIVESLKKEGVEVIKDVEPFLGKFSLNAICESAMGTVLMDNDVEQNRYREALKKMGEIVFLRCERPWLKNKFIFSLTPMGRQQTVELKILHDFTMKIIERRKQFHDESGGKYFKLFSSESEVDPESSVPSYDVPLHKKRLAMLDFLIFMQREQGIIDDLGLREEVDTFIFEGHDTTNATMGFALLLLGENEECQARARAEIDAVLKESNGNLGVAELQKLIYLERCIKEALRLFPAVPMISRNVTQELQLKKYLLPPSTTAAVSIYDVHHDPNFWPQPDVFDPDRFLPERIEGRHPYSYIPFSAGPRNCIGQKFAMLEMKTFIGQLLHHFYLKPVVKLANLRLIVDLVIKSQDPLNIKFVPIR